MLATDVLSKKPKLEDFYRGDTVLYRVKLSSDQSGEPVDVSGTTAWLTLKDRSGDRALQVRSTNPSNSTTEHGVFYIHIPSNLTDTLAPAVYDYDLQISMTVGSNTETMTLVRDRVRILEDITRR